MGHLAVLVLAMLLAVGSVTGCNPVKKAHGWVCACSAELGCDGVPSLGVFDNISSCVVLASSAGGPGDTFTGERLNRTVRSFAASAGTTARTLSFNVTVKHNSIR